MTRRERLLSLIDEPYTGQSGSGRFRLAGKQVTESQSNPWPYNKGKADVGSDFSTTKESITIDNPGRLDGTGYFSGYPLNKYSGPVYAKNPVDVLNQIRGRVALSSTLTLYGMGSTAISRVLPTNPAVDAMTFAAEIAREGIPKAIGQSLYASRHKPLKGLADEHLNYQFGIAPVISDAMGLVDTVSKSEKILKQFERDSGRNIRRQYRFPTIHSDTTTSTLLSTSPYLVSGNNAYMVSGGQRTTVSTVTRDVWFSGCFTYYLNLGRSHSDRLEYAASQARRLYGVRLTPDVLWNLAPWSWAADWVANMGDVLHNLSVFSTDGLVMRYGYIMEHYTMVESNSLSGSKALPGFRGEYSGQNIAETVRYERKIRRKATPFGFGLDPGSFTGRQWSILAALGITRASR